MHCSVAITDRMGDGEVIRAYRVRLTYPLFNIIYIIRITWYPRRRVLLHPLPPILCRICDAICSILTAPGDTAKTPVLIYE